ncbi:CotH kinase family protein [Candidatus Soleaferrea massiliensis]|uniref:CotH kinase family protein n=1 Tax=Candidatus Soleaferrea massiliensis TaxID=1470354 RepID=UPI00058EFDE1|nr:CotH kinase family protein [Candidatus Soleaferrea massiliensis]
MKKQIKKALSICLATAMCVSMFSISALAADNDGAGLPAISASNTGDGVTFEKGAVNLRLDREETLKVQLTGSVSAGDLVFSSGDEAVVTVDQSGKLTPKKIGKAAVTVQSQKDASVKAECEVTVSNGLPMLFVNLDDGRQIGEIQKGDGLDATIRIEAGGLYDKDVNLEETPMVIAGRGNSTWGAPKKPYKFEFDSKTKVLDYKKAKKWVLLANYYDVSQMRNYMVMYAAQYFTNVGFAPRGTFVDLFVNGKYNGTYLLCEQVEIAENRVDIDKPDPSVVDGSYLFEIDEYGDTDERYFYPGFMTYSNNYWAQNLNSKVNIKKPKVKDITEEQFEFARDYVTRASQAVKDGNYEEYIDVDSLIDWYLLQEFMKNKDSDFYKSCYMYKSAGSKLFMGPIWDFDLTGANGRFGHWLPWNVDSPEEFCMQESSWMRTLFSYEKFEQQVKDRWAELRDNGTISKFIEAIDAANETLSYAIYQDDRLWHTIGTDPMYGDASKTFPTYALEVAFLRDWHEKRIAWLDEAFGYDPNKDDGIIGSDTLPIDRGNGLIAGIDNGTTVNQLLEKISAPGGEVKVLQADGSVYTGKRLGTGMKLQSMLNGAVADELTIVVKADMTGDGIVNIFDLLQVKLAILNGAQLEPAYFAAASLSGKPTINLTDLLLMKMVILGK